MPLLALLTALALLFITAAAGATNLESQREAFRAALPLAEAGDWAQVEPRLAELADYPLLPDLRAAWLRTQLGRVDDAHVREFLERYPDLGFSGALRRQWAASLARRGAWADFLALYEAHYAARGDTVLDCNALAARIALDRTEAVEEAALRRWLSPVSQPKECDRAFAWLEARDALTPQRRRERMELALDAGQLSLARWLARSLGDQAVDEVDRWRRMHDDPAVRLRTPTDWEDTPRDRALLLYGFNRLATTDPEAAAGRWGEFREHFAFETDERAVIDRRIALLHAWRFLPAARTLLESLPAESQDASTREWTVRMAIRDQDWTAIETAITRLDPEIASQPVWRYWQARVLEATGLAGAAEPIFAELAVERGYYSFMSADRLGADYNWRHVQSAPDEDVIAALELREDFIRARELFHTGLEAHGRAEWQQAIARLAPAERVQAAILASRWGWYSRAITAASGADAQDDLDLRFPLAWQPVFEEQSGLAGLGSAWVYGIARSESLFMPDVVSGAGAVGLMQLMPATGQQTARRAGLAYQGRESLVDPAGNVALGTRYLAEMLARFGDHRVLATAAYNAGPTRVDRWLPEAGPLPAESWVDSLPFSETRGYIQRVLASEAVFQWRLSGETVRISDAMQPVPARHLR